MSTKIIHRVHDKTEFDSAKSTDEQPTKYIAFIQYDFC